MAKASASTYQDEYLQIIRELDGDPAGRAAANEYLFDAYQRTAGVVNWATSPYIINSAQYAVLDEAASTMSSIMEKVMFKYHRDRSFRSLFALDPKVEELTLVPSGFRKAVPLARIDLFFNPESCDFKIGGIVTGGIDGMSASGELVQARHNTQSFQRFMRKHPNAQTTDAMYECIDTIMSVYGSWTNAEEGRNHPTHPSLAVVDTEGSPRMAETKIAIEAMRERGCYARATYISQLRIETIGGIRQLVDNHGPITCVWLRATADDAVAHPCEGLDALVKATRRGMVCTIGGWRSWPCCTRNFTHVLRSKDGRALLSAKENAFVKKHIPKAYRIDPAIDLSAFFDQENWVIKTGDGAMISSVKTGISMSKMEWRTRLAKGIKRHDAVQAFIEQYPMLVAHADDNGNPVESIMNPVLRLYVFGGKLKSIAASCGAGVTTFGRSTRHEMGCIVVPD